MERSACRRGRAGRQELTSSGPNGIRDYLQELVNEYEKRDRRQGHGRDDAVAGFPDQDLRRVQRQGRCLRHGRRRLAVARRRLDRRPLCRPDRLLQAAQRRRGHGPGDGEVLRRISRQQRQVLGDPARRRRQRLGLSQGLVRGPEGDGQPSRPSTATTSACPRTSRQLRDIAEFFHRPDEKRYGIAIYTDNCLRRAGDGLRERASSRYGGELGDYATYKVDGIINSDKNDRGARSLHASSTSSRRRAGPRRSSSRTTRRSPRAWRR